MKRVFADKGIGEPRKFLVKNGFSSFVAHSLLNEGQPHFRYKHVEKLCVLMKCTPDALLDWIPDKDVAVEDGHPLQKLKVRSDRQSITARLSELSPEGIEKVRGFLDEMKKSV